MSAYSPRLTVREPPSWTMRLLSVVIAGLAGAMAMWAYETGQFSSAATDDPRAQLARYKAQLETVGAERDRLSATVNAAESQLNIERAAQKQMMAQMKVLEADNVRLKEDLAFFDSLLPNATGPAGIAIRRLKVDQIAPNQLRYRLLIMQGGQGGRRFVGSLQLVVTALQGDKSAMMTFPAAVPAEQEKFRLNFMHYQRVEGVLTLPEGAVTKLVQARVLENGQVKTQLAANL